MARRFSLAADVKPTVDSSAAEREAAGMRDTFEDELGDITVGTDDDLDSLGGVGSGRGDDLDSLLSQGGGSGAGTALGAASLGARASGGGAGGALGAAGGGLASVALGGAVGFGILQGVRKLADASPALQQTASMFGEAMDLFFRPFGNFLADKLRPLADDLLDMAVSFNELFSDDVSIEDVFEFAVDTSEVMEHVFPKLTAPGIIADVFPDDEDVLTEIASGDASPTTIVDAVNWPDLTNDVELLFDKIDWFDLSGTASAVVDATTWPDLTGYGTDVIESIVWPSVGADAVIDDVGWPSVGAEAVVGAVTWPAVTGGAVINAVDWPNLSSSKERIVDRLMGTDNGEPDLSPIEKAAIAFRVKVSQSWNPSKLQDALQENAAQTWDGFQWEPVIREGWNASKLQDALQGNAAQTWEGFQWGSVIDELDWNRHIDETLDWGQYIDPFNAWGDFIDGVDLEDFVFGDDGDDGDDGGDTGPHPGVEPPDESPDSGSPPAPDPDPNPHPGVQPPNGPQGPSRADLIDALTPIVPNLALSQLPTSQLINIAESQGVDVPGLQSGGVVRSQTLAQVGEGGQAEAVMPLDDLSREIQRAIRQGMRAGGGQAGGRNDRLRDAMQTLVSEVRQLRQELSGGQDVTVTVDNDERLDPF